MARRRRSRKSIKLKPGLLFLVLGVGLVISMFHSSDNDVQQSHPVPAVSTPAMNENGSGMPTVSSLPPTSTEHSKPAEAGLSFAAVTRFVKGRKVALREGPGKQFGILDRYDSGREIQVTETNGDWSKAKDVLTAREGWIATSLLSVTAPQPKVTQERKPEEDSAPAASQSQPVKPSLPQISDAMVVQRIIAESISMYPGTCACPYNTDRGGRRCGKRSAYNRGGGYAPICFAGDVSSEMVQTFRQQASR